LIRVCALVPYPPDTTPSQRFRLEQWAPDLDAAGIHVDLVPFADDALMNLLHKPGRRIAKALSGAAAFWRRLRRMALLPGYDAVVIHRTVCLAGPAVLERVIARLGRPVVFDFDDAIYLLHTTAANRAIGWLKFPGKTATLCRISSHVVVANAELAAYARRYNPRVSIVPSSVDTDRYRPLQRAAAQGPLVIGWTGSSTSQAYIEMFGPVLRELLSRRPVALHVHSDREPVMPGIPFVWHKWSPDNEVDVLSRFDIGIMPMPDDAWARGKSAMKALLYMAMGIPVVCSSVGTNREVVRHGENGLLAATAEEWLTGLEMLIDDAALRKRLGAAGRSTVVERYSRRHCAGLFADVVREAVGSLR
jgi:glycosyltransferase involved in cell wall biosynthesis